MVTTFQVAEGPLVSRDAETMEDEMSTFVDIPPWSNFTDELGTRDKLDELWERFTDLSKWLLSTSLADPQWQNNRIEMRHLWTSMCEIWPEFNEWAQT